MFDRVVFGLIPAFHLVCSNRIYIVVKNKFVAHDLQKSNAEAKQKSNREQGNTVLSPGISQLTKCNKAQRAP